MHKRTNAAVCAGNKPVLLNHYICNGSAAFFCEILYFELDTLSALQVREEDGELLACSSDICGKLIEAEPAREID